MTTMRLQRFLAQAGVASRRKAEALITEGRVKVNGKVVTELGTKVDPDGDKVVVGGRRLLVERPVYLLCNKPRGYVTTVSDPEGRPTVMALIPPQSGRVYPVGRLDFNTEGLLLFTNDGDLANALMHPRREIEKTYHVKLRGVASAETVAALERGVELDGAVRKAKAKLLKQTEGGHNSWLEVTIHEGRNRQIHRMAEAIGFDVAKLQRVRYAGLGLGELPLGKVRPLSTEEVSALRKATGGAPTTFEKVKKRSNPSRRDLWVGCSESKRKWRG